MSLFGSLLGDMEDDPFFGSHMRTMRQMNNMMNSLFADPFAIMRNDFDNRALTHRSSMPNPLMPFGFPVNRLLSGSLDSLGDNTLGHNTLGHNALGHNALGHAYSSSTVISMTSGPDGRPQVYKATSSTRVAPGGVKETQRTVCDSMTGTKKMAIGHHIGERAHIIEREQNVHSGDQEERQDFINIEEDEADDFNKEWETRSRSHSDIPRITAGGSTTSRNRHGYGAYGHSGVPAITAGSSSRRHRERHSSSSVVSPRRSIRSSPLALPPSSSPSIAATRTPYSAPGQAIPRKHKNIKTVSGSPPSPKNDN